MRLLPFLFALFPLAAAEAPKAKVGVIVVLASEDDATIDPRLKNIAEEVRKLNPSLKGFKVKSTMIRDLTENDKTSFPLVGDRTVEITVRQAMDKDGKTTLAVTPPEQGEIVFRLAANK